MGLFNIRENLLTSGCEGIIESLVNLVHETLILKEYVVIVGGCACDRLQIVVHVLLLLFLHALAQVHWLQENVTLRGALVKVPCRLGDVAPTTTLVVRTVLLLFSIELLLLLLLGWALVIIQSLARLEWDKALGRERIVGGRRCKSGSRNTSKSRVESLLLTKI